MSLMEELQNKLVTTEERVVSVLDELQKFSDLKKSLDATDNSLLASSEKLGDLTTSLTKNADAMRETIGALRETIDVIKRTDPAQVVEALTRVENKLQGLDKNFSGAVQDLDKKLSETVLDVKGSVLEKIDQAKGQLAVTVEGLGEEISQAKKSAEAESKSGKIRQFVIITLLILNFATLVYVGLLANKI